MNFAIRLLSLACALLISGALHAQRLMLAPPPPKVNVLAGVIDLHVHTEPDVFARSVDDMDWMLKKNPARFLGLDG